MNRKASKLSYLYLFFILIVGLSAFTQWYVSGNEEGLISYERNIINISSQQTSHAQGIVKHAFLMLQQDSMSGNERKVMISRYRQLLQDLKKGYETLTQSKQNPNQVKKLLTKQKKPYIEVLKTSEKLIRETKSDTASDAVTNKYVANIVAHEAIFYDLSLQINSLYAKQIKALDRKYRRHETLFFIIVFIIAILGAGILYFLAQRAIQKSFSKLEKQNETLLKNEQSVVSKNIELEKLYTELKNSEAELKEKEKSLTNSEEELRQQTKELLAVNNKLVQNEKERKGFLEDLKNSEKILSGALFKLRANQVELERLSLVAEKITNGVTISDKNGVIEWVNNSIISSTGYSSDELIGKKLGSILQGKDTNPDTVTSLQEHMAHAKACEVDILNYTKQHKPYWIHLSLTPVFNKRKTLINFIAIQSDITEKVKERKRLDELILKLNNSQEKLTTINSQLITKENSLATALNEQKELWNALNKSSLVSITDLKGNIIEVNDPFCEASKYTSEEIKQQGYKLINSGYHTQDFWKQMWEKVRAGKTWRGEICNQAKDGETYWLDAVINPVFDRNGDVKRYMSILNVITERKKLELKVEEDSKILERKNRIIRANQELLEEKNKAITDSINYASRIQRAMLPNKDIYKEYMPEHFIFYKPRDIVSGDFYWFGKKDQRTIVAVADCTGHGIPGAMMSMIGNQLFHSFINVLGISTPEYILIEINDAIRQTLRQQQTSNRDGMDVALCVIDTEYQELEFAGAKNPLVYIQEGELKKLKGGKFPVGGYSGARKESYQTWTIDISKPTHVYLYSDGFQDQFGGTERRKFMSKNFRNLLYNIHQEPISEQKNILDQTLTRWRGDTRQIDDILVIGMKVDLSESIQED